MDIRPNSQFYQAKLQTLQPPTARPPEARIKPEEHGPVPTERVDIGFAPPLTPAGAVAIAQPAPRESAVAKALPPLREAPPKLLTMDDPVTTSATPGELAVQKSEATTLTAAQKLQSGGNLEKVRDESWDRFNGSLSQLSPPAKEAYQNVLTLVVSDFAKDAQRAKSFQEATPEKQIQVKERWTAEAAAKFAQKPVDCLVANGHFEVLDPALVKNMGDGARQFLEASDQLEVKNQPAPAPPAARSLAASDASEKVSGGLGGFLSAIGSFFARAPRAQKVGKADDADSSLKTVKMSSHYKGEHKENNSVWKTAVIYLNEQHRAPYKVEVRDGKLYDAKGELFDTTSAKSLHSSGGNAIFIMTESGEIFASLTQKAGVFHHSSLNEGKPVAAAGELQVEKGVLKMISNRSGHYRPPSSHTDQALAILAKQGLDVSQVKKEGF